MSVAITAQAPRRLFAAEPLHRKQPRALARPASRGLSTFSPRPAWTSPTETCKRRPTPWLRAGRCSGSCVSSSRRRIKAMRRTRPREPGRGPPPPRRRLNSPASTRLAPLASLTPSPNSTRSASLAHSVSLLRSISIPPAVCLRDRRRNRLGPAWSGKGRVSAMADKMTNDLMDSAIHGMWTRVVISGTNSVTKNVMSLLKGQ